MPENSPYALSALETQGFAVQGWPLASPRVLQATMPGCKAVLFHTAE